MILKTICIAIHSHISKLQSTLTASSSNPLALILTNKLPCQSKGTISNSQPPHVSFFLSILWEKYIFASCSMAILSPMPQTSRQSLMVQCFTLRPHRKSCLSNSHSLTSCKRMNLHKHTAAKQWSGALCEPQKMYEYLYGFFWWTLTDHNLSLWLFKVD